MTTKRFFTYIEILGFVLVLLMALSISYLFVSSTHIKTQYIDWYIFRDNDVQEHRLREIESRAVNAFRKAGIDCNECKFNIILVNSDLLYALINPLQAVRKNGSEFASTYGEWAVFLKHADTGANKCIADGKHIVENLDAALAHEMVHVFQYHKYGILEMIFRAPYWVKEGYPTYVTYNMYLGKVDEKKLLRSIILRSYRELPEQTHISYSYLIYALMVKHAIEKMHKSIDELHEGKVSYDEVLGSLLEAYGVAMKKQLKHR